MSNKRSMSYQPRAKATAPAATAPAAGEPVFPGFSDEDVFNVPLLPVATKDAMIGARKVTFVKPKFEGIRAFAKHGRRLADLAERLQDPNDLDAQFGALADSAAALRELVPFLVVNHDQRAHVLAAFDDPAIPLDRLVMCLFGVLSKVMNAATLGEAVEAAADEAEADHGVDVSETITAAAAAADETVDAEVVELPTGREIESGIVDEPLPLPEPQTASAPAEDATAA